MSLDDKKTNVNAVEEAELCEVSGGISVEKKDTVAGDEGNKSGAIYGSRKGSHFVKDALNKAVCEDNKTVI